MGVSHHNVHATMAEFRPVSKLLRAVQQAARR
jgi:hypothetical protein